MGQKSSAPKSLGNVIETIPYLTKFPSNRYWIDYDKEADVLYISFDRPQNATESITLEDGIIVRYRNKKIVGITILDASERKAIH